MTELFLKDQNASKKFAQDLAKEAKKGDIFFLYGQLGAGKTFFVAEFCKELGVSEYVSSPSYVLLNEYESREFPIFHLDLYRLGNAEELLEIGITDFTEEGIVLIEWPEIAEELIISQRVELYFEILGNARKVKILDRRSNGAKEST